MNDEQRIKLEELKKHMLEKKKNQNLQNNVIFQECLTALEFYEIVENESVIKELVHLASLPNVEMYSQRDTIKLSDDERYYIVWDELTLPVVVSCGKYIKESWDDVLAVSFETYLVAESSKKTIGIK